MGLFICENCRCIENTATGHWWSRHIDQFKGTIWEKALCSECTPTTFPDGTANPRGGKWHNYFPKESVEEYLKNGGDLKDLYNAKQLGY